ncbi:MAG: ribbon-helix-helix protein, CopG family [Actinobacteria bacterium]|nr:ribbon-helix-helix protein, CopG family [Actinomycetota bacterium]MBA3566130.1 ribbon-helix-helix protein, CopG family [Actinomycetota bacterium]
MCHATTVAQLVTRIDDDLAKELDELVLEGVAESRSDAVRQALRALLDRHRRRKVGEAIVEGYRRQPQTDEEVGWADEATVRMIAEEPW